ncbi:GNAT family N-acetyltransferase [Streptococcus sp. zg-JUN1979]|uniref:GNAT family N-acetyltransferase n=1 Tax=Streptococcus sp. zg-JUN1979 TaxID=3391450 RepID=UPI0039A772C4
MRQTRELILKEADEWDAKPLAKLLACVTQETDFVVQDSLVSWDEADLAPYLADSKTQINSLCLLALLEDEAIGLITIVGGKSLSLSHIGDVFIAVKKNYWGLGIAQALLEMAIDWAEHSGVIRRLELSVQARNSVAIHIYKKYGFEIEGIKKRGAREACGHFLDVYMMAKLIEGK